MLLCLDKVRLEVGHLGQGGDLSKDEAVVADPGHRVGHVIGVGGCPQADGDPSFVRDADQTWVCRFEGVLRVGELE